MKLIHSNVLCKLFGKRYSFVNTLFSDLFILRCASQQPHMRLQASQGCLKRRARNSQWHAAKMMSFCSFRLFMFSVLWLTSLTKACKFVLEVVIVTSTCKCRAKDKSFSLFGMKQWQGTSNHRQRVADRVQLISTSGLRAVLQPLKLIEAALQLPQGWVQIKANVAQCPLETDISHYLLTC